MKTEALFIALGIVLEGRCADLKPKKRRRAMSKIADVAKAYLKAAKLGRITLSDDEVAALEWLRSTSRRLKRGHGAR